MLSWPLCGHAAPWRFMVYGDSRALVPWEMINDEIVNELVAETLKFQPDFVLVPGDLVYSGSLDAFNYWRNVMAPVYDAGIAVFPVVGNHELPDIPSYMAVFGPGLPDNGPVRQIDRSYFIRTNNSLLVVLDEFAGPGYFDLAWLRDVLATNTAPHVFVSGHMPAFKVYHYDCLDGDQGQRDEFWSLLAGAGCRIYFCGHDHFYDHMRVDDGNGNADDDVHQFIVGTAGATIYGDGAYDGSNGVWTPLRIHHESNYGYVIVDVDGLNVATTWYYRADAGTYEAGDDTWSYAAQHRPALQLEQTEAGATVSFTARESMRYVLEQSDDLQRWTPVMTNTTPGLVRWPLDVSGAACRMFRVRQ